MELKSYEEIKAYYQGQRDSITKFAWWKDGIQYVGTTGSILGEILADLIRMENDTMQAFSEGKTIYTS